MLHLDLFSGIGGFAYAADQVFDDVEHIFCDNEPFAQAILKKHWPESEIYDDIKEITADTYGAGRQRTDILQQGRPGIGRCNQPPFLLTGGFPCQPFSSAGLRRGTADDRHLWPEMLRVIRLTAPEWVIAENVGGILTWNEGLVFEQVCSDLEAAGYEIQPFVIPAVAVNAPHRRDRVWFVANRTGNRRQRRRTETKAKEGHATRPEPSGELPGGFEGQDSHVANIGRERWRSRGKQEIQSEKQTTGRTYSSLSGWERDWAEVAAELCSVDDGLPAELDGFKLTKPQHRAAQLKAYGNAIVPQVAIEIMKAIKVQSLEVKENLE